MGETNAFDNNTSGQIKTDNRIPIASGQVIVANEALMLNGGGTALITYNSATGGAAFHSIATRDVDASGGAVYTDYITGADEFNGSKLVLSHAGDTWQDIAEEARALGINLVTFNTRDLTALEESEST